jgi:replicative DNA helicase
MERKDNDSLPYSEDGELGVLCSLILDPGLSDRIRSQIGLDYFYHPAHRIIYEKVKTLIDGGATTIDFAQLASRLKDAGQLEEVGGREALDRIFNFVPTASNFQYYVDDVLEKFAMRQALLAYTRRIDAIRNPHSSDEDWDPNGEFLGSSLELKLAGASLYDFRLWASVLWD